MIDYSLFTSIDISDPKIRLEVYKNAITVLKSHKKGSFGLCRALLLGACILSYQGSLDCSEIKAHDYWRLNKVFLTPQVHIGIYSEIKKYQPMVSNGFFNIPIVGYWKPLEDRAWRLSRLRLAIKNVTKGIK